MRTSRKRTIAIIVPVTVLALAGIATAAGLTTTSATLGGGSTTVTNNCAIRVSYTTAGSADVTYVPPGPVPTGGTTPSTPGGYYLTKVTLNPSGLDCNSASFKVTVAKANGAILSEAVGNFASTAIAVPVTITNAFAQDVGAVYATVTTTTPSTSPTTAP